MIWLTRFNNSFGDLDDFYIETESALRDTIASESAEKHDHLDYSLLGSGRGSLFSHLLTTGMLRGSFCSRRSDKKSSAETTLLNFLYRSLTHVGHHSINGSLCVFVSVRIDFSELCILILKQVWN